MIFKFLDTSNNSIGTIEALDKTTAVAQLTLAGTSWQPSNSDGTGYGLVVVIP